ncbi:RDD family protein [Halopseudomonas sp.]|uniref:RDD family protein n=1 Tax=Halopseudomonas sp. TaxID=2901191 RepID=UPI00311EECEE
MSVKQLQPIGDFPPTGLFRRLFAAGYDLLLLLAALMVATLIYLSVHIWISGEAAAHAEAEQGAYVGDPILTLVVVLITIGFYSWFWTKKGQSLGMQAWRIRLQQPDGRSISGRQALVRLAVAQLSWLCGGLGFLWQLWDRESRTWHDIASDTRLVTLPKGTFKD